MSDDVLPPAALATLAASVTGESDLWTTMHAATSACTALGAAAVGVLVRPASGGLEILGASSHEAYLLELFQKMCEEGPCVDCIEQGRVVHAADAADLSERWPRTGTTIVDAGFIWGLALPLTWRGFTFGGLNLFFKDGRLSGGLTIGAQSVADILTVGILHSEDAPNVGHVYGALQSALDTRSVVERAKGVIAQQDGIAVADAYTSLVDHALGSGMTISAAAAGAVERAERGESWKSAIRATQ